MDERLAALYAYREAMTDAVVRDLVGPTTVDEIVPDPPLTHYLAGILHPQDLEADPIVVDTPGIDRPVDGSDEDDDATAMANSRYPSSMGLTFAVEGDPGGELAVEVDAGTYTDVGHGW